MGTCLLDDLAPLNVSKLGKFGDVLFSILNSTIKKKR